MLLFQSPSTWCRTHCRSVTYQVSGSCQEKRVQKRQPEYCLDELQFQRNTQRIVYMTSRNKSTQRSNTDYSEVLTLFLSQGSSRFVDRAIRWDSFVILFLSKLFYVFIYHSGLDLFGVFRFLLAVFERSCTILLVRYLH